jgi:hypothetical protein
LHWLFLKLFSATGIHRNNTTISGIVCRLFGTGKSVQNLIRWHFVIQLYFSLIVSFVNLVCLEFQKRPHLRFIWLLNKAYLLGFCTFLQNFLFKENSYYIVKSNWKLTYCSLLVRYMKALMHIQIRKMKFWVILEAILMKYITLFMQRFSFQVTGLFLLRM